MTNETTGPLTYLTPSDAAPKRNDAVARIREMLPEGVNLLGAEAHEFKPGAVVLLVLTFPQYAERQYVERLSERAVEICTMLGKDGVKACAMTIPEGTTLRAFEVPDAAR